MLTECYLVKKPITQEMQDKVWTSNIAVESDVTLGWKDLSLGQILLKQLSIYDKRVAQVDAYTGKEQTFEYILNASRKLAVFLQRKGIEVNDTIAICSENNLEYCIAVYGIICVGATVSPLNPQYSAKEFKHALDISKPKYIFISAIAFNNIKNIITSLHWSPKILMLNEHHSTSTWLSLSKAMLSVSDDDMNAFQAVSVNVDDHIAAILYSSGTTGLIKGVMLTDKNIISSIKIIVDLQLDEHKFITASVLPFFHGYGFIGVLLRKIVTGNLCIIFPRFNGELFLQCIEKYRIEHLPLVPPLMVFLAKHPHVEKYDLSSVKAITCGAAPLSQEIRDAVIRRLNNPDIREGYGLTEFTLGLMFSTNDKTRPGSFMLIPNVLAKVIPLGEFETDESLGPNCRGELCFKGDLLMKGYCNDEKSTRATIDKDGWLHTGDIGYYDEVGYYYVVDRIKELIKYKAYQVPPAELEAILLTYPGVKDAAVIGIPDEKAGELPMAFIVKQDNANICEKDIVQYVNERVSNSKRLRGGVKFLSNIPKTASGKILRRILRDALQSKL